MSGLAVPNPSTLAPGNIVTGALWNAQVRDALNFLVNPPIFLASASVTTSVPTNVSSNTLTRVTLNTTLVDNYGGFNSASSSYVAPVSGWYYCTGTVAYPSSGVGIRVVAFFKNGSPYSPQAYGMLPSTNSGWLAQGVQGTQLMYLSQGDSVDLRTGQDSGGTISTGSFSYLNSQMQIMWIHG